MRVWREHVVCADGATVSIQASEFHYCTPRDNDGPYSAIEAGFPSVPPPDSWLPFMDGDGDPTGCVYAYMPSSLVAEFVAAHGGMVGGALPPGVEVPRA